MLGTGTKGRDREMEGIHRELEETRFTMERLEIESRSVHENSSYLHNLRFSSSILVFTDILGPLILLEVTYPDLVPNRFLQRQRICFPPCFDYN